MAKVEDVARRIIPSGAWQLGCGLLLSGFGVFAALAATPFNGAGGVAVLCLSVGAPLLFWGIMLRYLSALEIKILNISERLPNPPKGPGGDLSSSE